MKKIIIALVLLLLAFCKKNNTDGYSHEKSENQTHIVTVGKYQAVFDLMPMKQHKEMMRAMKASMIHIAGATHGLMLTLLDYKTKKVIKGAKTYFTIVNPQQKAKTIYSEVLSGGTMHHYAIHFDGSLKGKYLVKAKFTVGKKYFNASTSFKIK